MKSTAMSAGSDMQTGARWMERAASRQASAQTWGRAWAKQAHNLARVLWTRARDRLDAHRRRWVAELLYTELSKLSDIDLERRGMARGDLYRLTREMAGRR
jgi:hypothetical protein